MIKYRPCFLLVMIAVFFSCNVKKRVPEGKKLLTGAAVTIREGEKAGDTKALHAELEELLRPKPNKKLLGMRVGLWAHNRVERKKGKFITKYLNKKYGEAPVYLDQVSADKTMELIQNRLENRGFFGSRIEVAVQETKKTAKINYTVFLTEPYILAAFSLTSDSLQIRKQIDSSLKRTLISIGMRYDLDVLKNERKRIDEYLKTKGYYNFNADYLIFRVDTNYGNKTFHMYMSVKADVPERDIIPYKIREIYVYPNYAVSDTSSLATTTEYDGIHFIQKEELFKPKYLRTYILFKKGDLYNKRRQNLTANRLTSIGLYQYVNVRYKESDSVAKDSLTVGFLDATIFLSPLSKQSVRLEMQGLSKSNNFVGPALLASYRNRNLFKGGELITLSGRLGFETQLAGGRQTGLNSYEAGFQAELVVPRVISPVRITVKNSFSVPKTTFSLSFSLLNRVQYYGLHSALASYGYRWNTSRIVTHDLRLVSINYIKLARTTEAFDRILTDNPFLRRSFEQQFIVGPTYTFQFNQLAGKEKKHRFFVTANADVAGNLIHFIQSRTGAGSGGPRTIFGEQYAQYSKVDLDVRHYLQLTKETRLVSRVYAGIGVPGNNSLSLPYVKQFFAGGPNSIRAFRIRSLGPGTYRSQTLDVASFFDQAGDIKLEANMEYRFPIISVVKGALFADAGNIWLINGNPTLGIPGGGSFSSRWAQELAVGAGFGFRVDIGFFVIRLDASTPLRKPFLPENDRWTTSFKYGSGSWRKENLVWNFAINYPF